MDSADFSGINDDEMLAAVLEMSGQEAGLSGPPPMEEEAATSSPDTGFGDTDAHALAYHTDLMEAESKQPAGKHTRIRTCLKTHMYMCAEIREHMYCSYLLVYVLC